MTPRWLGLFTESAARLAKLPAGWDGPGSVPASSKALFRAERITRDALIGFLQAAGPYLVPVGDGGVQVEWHGATGEIELTVGPGGDELSVWFRDHLTGAELEGQDEEARALFLGWAPWIAASGDDASDETVAGPEATFAAATSLRANASTP
jgi:hypothetical protein